MRTAWNTSVVVASSGPPCVITLTWENRLNAAMVMVIRMKVRGVPQARPGDVSELLPGGGAVDRGRLVQLTGNGLQTGQPDHHVEADGLPDRQAR